MNRASRTARASRAARAARTTALAALAALAAAAAALAGCLSSGAVPCGDGFCVAGQRCDQGACVSAATCGDERVDAPEACDEGADNSNAPGAACREDCRAGGCGDAILDPGETCDPAAGLSAVEPDACRPGCQVARCGDGIVDDGEARGCLEPARLRPDLRGGLIAAGDLDADGSVDVVVLDPDSSMLHVYRGAIDGSNLQTSRLLPGAGQGLAIGDVDGVAGDEIIVDLSTSSAAYTIWRLVDGVLVAGPTTAHQTTEELVGVADVDGDGTSDLVATVAGDEKLGVVAQAAVRRAAGGGAFADPVHSPLVVAYPELALLARIGADARAELLVIGFGGQELWIHEAGADARFTAPRQLPVGAASEIFGDQGAAVADFNGDGRPDIAVARNLAVRIFAQTLTGDFVLVSTLPTEDPVTTLVATDMGGDGRIELFAASAMGAGWLLVPDEGDVGPRLVLEGGGARLDAVIVDLEGDGFSDVLVSDVGGTTWTLRGADGLLGAPSVAPVSAMGLASTITGDFDGDGAGDLFLPGTPGYMALGQRAGPPLVTAVTFVVEDRLVAVDFTGSGTDQIAVVLPGSVTRWRWDRDAGALVLVDEASWGQGAEFVNAVAAGDFDGDGREELVALQNHELARFDLDAAGALRRVQTLPPGPPDDFYASTAAGDLDGDGDAELVLMTNLGGYLRAGGPGGLGEIELAVDLPLATVDLGVFEPGAGMDLVTSTKAEMSLLRWRPGAAPFTRSTILVSGRPRRHTVVDLSGDGLDDVLVPAGDEGLDLWLARGDGTLVAAPTPRIGLADEIAVISDAAGRAARLVVNTYEDEFGVGSLLTLGVRR